jgi:hypothetical protein
VQVTAPAAPADFSRAEKFLIAACAVSMLIVQMDWFALNLALLAFGRQRLQGAAGGVAA